MSTSFDVGEALSGLRGKGPALVLMHDNPDPDCMAAAECLRALLMHEMGVPVTVGRGGIIGRAENRAMVQVLGLMHVPMQHIDFANFGIIALVDTQPETGNNSLPKGHRVEVVVDHHPLGAAARRAPWCDVREDYGASSTIAYSYLQERKVPISAQLATALLYAIKSETKDLARESSQHELEAFRSLMPLADFSKLHHIAEPKVPAAHFAALDRALRAAEVRGSFVAVNLGTLDYPDLVAEIADLLLPYDRAHWILCMGQHQGTVFLSVRTDDDDAHAGELIRAVVGPYGAAGGHGAIAGGRLHVPLQDEADLAPVYARIVESMARELELTSAPPVPLLSPADRKP
jgi:nanoRNase/pAp phosphatase (c-di-AMP/oligoRNAs hydrolase)